MAWTTWSCLVICVTVTLSSRLDDRRHGDDPFNDSFLEQVLARAKTWTPDTAFRGGIRFGEFRSIKGIYESPLDFTLPSKRLHASSLDEVVIPDRFDAREKWPFCQSIHSVRNQGTCGSCWAVATVSVMSDRLCIHSDGEVNLELATEDLMGCCKDCGNGCNGGFLDGTAFQYWVDAGLVSGAPYNSSEGCKPYPFEPCSYPFVGCHHEKKNPKCLHHCINGYDRKYRKDKFFGATAYKIPNNARMIQLEIMTNGPVATGFEVFEDFYFYHSGVYKHVVGKKVGMHAIRIVGWGTENGTPYWLIANSYGDTWGDKGFFKMLRGSNHLGIESTVIAGLPQL